MQPLRIVNGQFMRGNNIIEPEIGNREQIECLGCFLAQFRVLYPAYAVVVGTILVSRVFPSKSNR